MTEINSQILDMAFLELGANGDAVVFGDGREDSDVMLIGEAPGQNEVIEKRPFVGKAGKNLDEFLEATKLVRDRMYITNVVKIRPTRVSDSGNTVNRAPNKREIALFLPFLKMEIEKIRPRIIVTLGNVPLKALTDDTSSIGDMHGNLIKYKEYPLFPMYHPAAVIYNRALRDTYFSDMGKLARTIASFAFFSDR